MNRLMQLAFLWAMALCYGAAAIVYLFVQIFKKGFGATFSKKKHERPAQLDDPTLGTHGFLHLEKVRIHYVASGPENKPLMLFVHGFPEFWYSWRNQIREFQNDYRCVAIDQRGYGESDKPTDIESYKLQLLGDDIKQIILALGYKSCVLVGHDWGALVAWYFARQYPDFVHRLIVMNAPPAPVFRKVIATSKKQAKMSWYIFFFQLPYLPEFMLGLSDLKVLNAFGDKESKVFVNPLSEKEIETYKYNYSQSGAWTPPLNYYRAAQQLDPVKYDLNYSMPILLVWGLQDTALSIDLLEAVEKSCPKITSRRIPDSGHFVQMDAPSAVNQAMREWLKSNEQA